MGTSPLRRAWPPDASRICTSWIPIVPCPAAARSICRPCWPPALEAGYAGTFTLETLNLPSREYVLEPEAEALHRTVQAARRLPRVRRYGVMRFARHPVQDVEKGTPTGAQSPVRMA